MTERVNVGKVTDIASGGMKKITIKDHEILLIRVNDQYYAVDNRCPHFGGDLSKGKIDGLVIICPLHGSRFDITSGHIIQWTTMTGIIAKIGKAIRSPKPLKTYQVQIVNDDISVIIG